MSRIGRRKDVSLERGKCEYGDVEFADSVNNRYPIGTEDHIRAAWSNINHEDNTAKYHKDEVGLLKKRSLDEAEGHGVEIDPSTADWSAYASIRRRRRHQRWQYRTTYPNVFLFPDVRQGAGDLSKGYVLSPADHRQEADDQAHSIAPSHSISEPWAHTGTCSVCAHPQHGLDRT